MVGEQKTNIHKKSPSFGEGLFPVRSIYLLFDEFGYADYQTYIILGNVCNEDEKLTHHFSCRFPYFQLYYFFFLQFNFVVHSVPKIDSHLKGFDSCLFCLLPELFICSAKIRGHL